MSPSYNTNDAAGFVYEDLVTFDTGVTMGGASGANVVTVPDNVAQALNVVDAGGIEYVRVDSQNAQPAVVWNNGEADADFRICANAGISDPTDAFFLEGSTGRIFMGDIAPTNIGHLTVSDLALNTVAGHIGGVFHHIKTAGVTDQADTFRGLYTEIELNQVGGIIGHMRGIYTGVVLTAGAVGTVANNRNVYSSHAVVDLDGGTINGHVIANLFSVDQEAANTTTGDIYVAYLQLDCDGTVTGTTYMQYMNELTGVDYCMYQNGTATNHFGGITSIGGTVTPLAQLHVDQSGAAAAIPVAYFDQADVSEEMFEFATTIGVGNAIEAVGAKALTTTHFIKVTLPGALTRYIPVGTIA